MNPVRTQFVRAFCRQTIRLTAACVVMAWITPWARAQFNNIETRLSVVTPFNFVPSDVSGDGRVVVGTDAVPLNPRGYIATRSFSNSLNDTTYGVQELIPPSPYVGIQINAVSLNGTTVVGRLQGDFGSGLSPRAFRWTQAGGFQLLPGFDGASSLNASDVSGDGSIVVGTADSNSGAVATRWNASGQPSLVGTLAEAVEFSPLGVSADGNAIVGASAFNALQWWAGSGLFAINAVLPSDPPGFIQRTASRVSADGNAVIGNSIAFGRRGWVLAGFQARELVDINNPLVRSDATGLTTSGRTILGNTSSGGGLVWKLTGTGLTPSYLIGWRDGNGVTQRYSTANAISEDESTIVGVFSSGQGTGFIHQRTPSRRIDVSNDDLPDIFWRNASTGQNGVWSITPGREASGSQTALDPAIFAWWSLPDVPGGQGWAMQAIVDLTGDGIMDVVWRNTTTGLTGFWSIMAGGVQRWTTMTSAPADTAWSIIGSGDANLDRIDDIFWYNATTGQCGWWLMQPLGVIGSWQSLPTVAPSTGWRPVLVGSVVADPVAPSQVRTPEIFWRNAATGENGLWVMGTASGNSFIASWLSLPTVSTPGWSPRMIQDFTSDGVGDILWHSSTTGQCGLWSMSTSGAINRWISLPTVAAGWVPGP